MKIYIVVLLLSIHLFINAQNGSPNYNNEIMFELKKDANDIAQLKSYLLNKYAPSQGLDLKLVQKNTSLIGSHFCFQWHYNNKPLYQKYIKINIAFKGQILSEFNDLITFEIDESSNNVNTNCLYELNQVFIPVQKVRYNNLEQLYSNGMLIYEYDLSSYNKDTTLLNHVFNPDPVTTATTIYGGRLTDSNDIHYPFIDSLYLLTQVPVTISDDTLFFQNEFVKIYSGNDASVEADYILLKDVKLFTRNDKAFEAMNCLYHIYHYQKYIQNLNIKDLAAYQLPVNPHARPDDQSSFVPNTLLFGDGFVDDAEDVEVVIHEYGHALIESASNGTNIGFERKALDEGSCDYLATGYTKNISTYASEKVFPWDGHNKLTDTSKFGWDGRVINSSKIYPFDMSNNSIHKSGEIWSSCLLEIANDIGREQMDKILLTAYYSATSNISYTQFALLLLQADSMLYQHKYQYNLCKYLTKRGILNGQCYNNISLPNQSITRFVSNSQTTYIENISQELFHISIYSVDGKELKFWKSNEPIIELNQGLSEGIYIVKLYNSNKEFTYKWINLHP